jgi:4-diphosphocytidyl-2-C-methyl-D-erythritol kinase
MITFPNAKINLGLNITERRHDGYHHLESVFYPVSLSDILEVLPSDTYSFQSTGMSIDAPPENNLVTRAYQLLAHTYILPPVMVHLHKSIPLGAGLGGGSSDAAYMLKMLNECFKLDLTNAELKNLASRLGADCPFFIDNQQAFVTGIGDVFSSINLQLNNYHIALVKPPVAVSTAEAYRMIVPRKAEVPVAEAIKQPVEQWKELLVNDFETPVCSMFPEIASVKEDLYNLGALYASMSGSGSAVYGLFAEKPEQLHHHFPQSYFVWY